MKNKILNILEKYDIDSNDLIAILNVIDGIDVAVKNVPIVIGHLNRKMGYNTYEPLEIGTEVFELDKKFFIVLKPINKTLPNFNLYFSKEEISKCATFK